MNEETFMKPEAQAKNVLLKRDTTTFLACASGFEDGPPVRNAVGRIKCLQETSNFTGLSHVESHGTLGAGRRLVRS
jgi:hypothetical protein